MSVWFINTVKIWYQEICEKINIKHDVKKKKKKKKPSKVKFDKFLSDEDRTTNKFEMKWNEI